MMHFKGRMISLLEQCDVIQVWQIFPSWRHFKAWVCTTQIFTWCVLGKEQWFITGFWFPARNWLPSWKKVLLPMPNMSHWTFFVMEIMALVIYTCWSEAPPAGPADYSIFSIWAHFSPFWSILIHLGHYGLFGPIWSLFDQFGLFSTNLIDF